MLNKVNSDYFDLINTIKKDERSKQETPVKYWFLSNFNLSKSVSMYFQACRVEKDFNEPEPDILSDILNKKKEKLINIINAVGILISSSFLITGSLLLFNACIIAGAAGFITCIALSIINLKNVRNVQGARPFVCDRWTLKKSSCKI